MYFQCESNRKDGYFMESHAIYPNAHITSMRPKNTVTNGGSTEI